MPTTPNTSTTPETRYTPRATWTRQIRFGLVVALFASFGLAACGGEDSNDETQQAGDTDSTEPSSDDSANDDGNDDNGNGDDGNGDGADDCGGVGIPDEFASFFTQGNCEFVECIFDELDVSSPDEFGEKFGDDGGDPTPEEIGEITRAIAACGQTLNTAG